MYENLFEPISLGPTKLRNRIFNPPHGTTLGAGGLVSDELIAYHEARARGGVGLIILEGMAFHPSFAFESAYLNAGRDDIIPGMARLSRACSRHGTAVFGQLFHAGRSVRYSHDGSRPLVYSASDTPDDRYRVVPIPMPNDMVWEVIESYAAAAARLAEAGLDGIEILASQGYLIGQFLNPNINHRKDEFGGSLQNRMRFLSESIAKTRHAIGTEKTLGVRVTLDEKTDSGVGKGETIEICRALEKAGHLDYFSVISGSSASPDGWIHVFPPMAVAPAFVADDAAQLKSVVAKPVLVAGRINQAQTASQILSEGKADMIGMVRALIADPDFPNKVAKNRSEDIRACIGCNQACVGHRLTHHAISCIQNPVTGRELDLKPQPIQSKRLVWVVGGGPGGMKAAVTAADQGHKVVLYEKQSKLGGQVNLAEKLPGRSEFGGVTTNLMNELDRSSVEICLRSLADPEALHAIGPDVIIVSTGAVPRLPDVEITDMQFLSAWSVIAGQKPAGQNVVIADWSSDWSGLGVAHMLALSGHKVRLLSGASTCGESIPAIVRDQWVGELESLNVELICYARFFGAQGRTAFFQHTINGEAIICEDVDAIVSCYPPQSNNDCDWMSDLITPDNPSLQIKKIGDALAPRTVEEAVLEGVKAAWSIR
jgi:2,4-dienoyl-CoA reductase-like NADH-dependent reductase (Old Yellow Enzyme family)